MLRRRPAEVGERSVRRRHLLVLLLTVNSGATDATGFLALGGAFTSVMTGNIVLLGTAAARADGQLAGHVAAAIVFYILGCALGAKLAGTPRPEDPVWPAAVRRALVVELSVFAIYALGWWATRGHPANALQLALLTMNSLALGIQSSAVQRFGVSGLSTTYLTGTLTMLVVRLSSSKGGREVIDSLRQLFALLAGAATAALLVSHMRILVPATPLACVTTVLLGSRRINQIPAPAHPAAVEAMQS